jgi:hypothetical protein
MFEVHNCDMCFIFWMVFCNCCTALLFVMSWCWTSFLVTFLGGRWDLTGSLFLARCCRTSAAHGAGNQQLHALRVRQARAEPRWAGDAEPQSESFSLSRPRETSQGRSGGAPSWPQDSAPGERPLVVPSQVVPPESTQVLRQQSPSVRLRETILDVKGHVVHEQSSTRPSRHSGEISPTQPPVPTYSEVCCRFQSGQVPQIVLAIINQSCEVIDQIRNIWGP